MALVARISMLQPSRNLLWRPQQPKLVGHDTSQHFILDQLAALGPTRAVPRGVVRLVGSVVL
jgi:hypothetical protein